MPKVLYDNEHLGTTQGNVIGRAPVGYRGTLDTVSCIHCGKSIATMKRGRRHVCLTCKMAGKK